MTTLMRRFALVAVAVSIGIAPLAHEICQVSCATPAASTRPAATGHEHCAQAARDDHAGAAKMSAARASDCRSRTSDALWTSVFVKVAAPASAILLLSHDHVLVGARALVRASSPPPSSISVPARTQLRV
jgi:hypothetical protein